MALSNKNKRALAWLRDIFVGVAWVWLLREFCVDLLEDGVSFHTVLKLTLGSLLTLFWVTTVFLLRRKGD